MITAALTRTPLRVSFAGGGTDLPGFSERHSGMVVSTAIDRYVVVRATHGPGPGDESEIVAACRALLGAAPSVRLSVSSDVPPGAGLGGSASLTVGTLHALHLLRGERVSARALAEEACRVEIEMLGRPVGRQDQYAVAYGGLNALRFEPGRRVHVEPLAVRAPARERLFGSLLLLWTRRAHDAAAILRRQAGAANDGRLLQMRGHAQRLRELLVGAPDVAALGRLLHETWQLKRALSDGVSTPALDGWYDRALEAGALGGKVCGAGGGGCLLLVVPRARRAAVRAALPELDELAVGYEDRGSRQLSPSACADAQ